MYRITASKSVVWAGIGLVMLTGLIHVVEAPKYFAQAPYTGVLFFANACGAALAAYGILRGYAWGWRWVPW